MWGPSPKTQAQIIAELRRKVADLEAQPKVYKKTFSPGALSISPQDTGEIALTFPGVRVGDAVVVSYPPTNPTLEVDAVIDGDDSVFITVYNPSAVVTANLSGTWSAFRLA